MGCDAASHTLSLLGLEPLAPSSAPTLGCVCCWLYLT